MERRTAQVPMAPRMRAGFALIVTVSVVTLLALVAIGLLSLSTVTVRSAGADRALAEARSNARLGIMLALAELQKQVGDDRRITADAGILTETDRSHAVGVWDSWSPALSKSNRFRAPDYELEKEQRFRRWLVSAADDEAIQATAWAKQPADQAATVPLFEETRDGFSLRGERLGVGGSGNGEMAWAVSQEATKAKIAVAGAKDTLAQANDSLHVQPRPNLALSSYLNEPDREDRTSTAAKLLDQRQVSLDPGIWKGPSSIEGGAHFTTLSYGLQTNVVDGGLKTDMNLGFEMDRSDFENPQWDTGSRTFQNPFHASGEKAFETPSIYQDQRTLYAHQGPRDTIVTHKVTMSDWDTAIPQFDFPIYAAPTFHTLRSHYRIPYHVFQTEDGPTVFERAPDHVSVELPRARELFARRLFPPPARYMAGEQTQSGVRPVLDRALYIVSAYVSPSGRLSYMFTPVITMWNPHNVALEIEGAVSYIWIDIPFRTFWSITGRSGSRSGSINTSQMGWQFDPRNPRSEGRPHGRSVDPYFYAAITHNGAPLSERGGNPTIRFRPGEVRFFVPSTTRKIRFDEAASVRARTIFLKPVEENDDWLRQLESGIYVETTGVATTDLVEMSFASVVNFGDDYPFFIGLEDATRAKGNNPNQDDDRYRGIITADVLSRYFAATGEGSGQRFRTPRLRASALQRRPYPYAVLETYHRTGLGEDRRGGGGRQSSDLVFTSNPRQAWMTDWIGNRSVSKSDRLGTTGPQYQTRMIGLTGTVSSFLGGSDGRNTFYGASHSSRSGRTELSFFEVPTSPMLSLGGFQHCDLSGTTFAPANQVGNSWASAYVKRDLVTSQQRIGVDGKPPARMIDHSFLLNEALWDGFFFSGAAPQLEPGNGPSRKSARFWNESNPVAVVTKDLETVLGDFVEDPVANPLRNQRMKLHQGSAVREDLLNELLEPQGCLKIAAHLLLDGPFNVNSTSKEAWMAVFSSLRDAEFELADGTPAIATGTLQSRLQNPQGRANDQWHGFRELSDAEIELLAEKIVEEVRLRGPFLSLAEFVNRRVERSDLGLKGALQAAIDGADLNGDIRQAPLTTNKYHPDSRENIVPADTGVGIPGYLTQADVLQSMAPIVTVRSDTFTIRAYGAAKDSLGNTVAEVWAEAVVQRMPEFVDSSNDAYTPVDSVTEANKAFGRRFQITSFRFLNPSELVASNA